MTNKKIKKSKIKVGQKSNTNKKIIINLKSIWLDLFTEGRRYLRIYFKLIKSNFSSIDQK
jgi:hypothetical protein